MTDKQKKHEELSELEQQQLELVVLDQEIRRREIARLDIPWWKKPSYIGAIAPTIVALTALVWAATEGIINLQLSRVENVRKDLELTKREAEFERARLLAEISDFEVRRAQVSKRFEVERDSLGSIIQGLRKPIITEVFGFFGNIDPEINIHGFNFGVKVGTVTGQVTFLTLYYTDVTRPYTPMWLTDWGPFDFPVQSWTDNRIVCAQPDSIELKLSELLRADMIEGRMLPAEVFFRVKVHNKLGTSDKNSTTGSCEYRRL